MMTECPECEGRGTFGPWPSWNDEHPIPCRHCRGSGRVRDFAAEDQDHADMLATLEIRREAKRVVPAEPPVAGTEGTIDTRRTETETCPHCGGQFRAGWRCPNCSGP